MPLSEPLAIGIARARDRALDAFRDLAALFAKADHPGGQLALGAIRNQLCGLRLIQEADRVVAEMVTDEKAVNGDASPNQPLP